MDPRCSMAVPTPVELGFCVHSRRPRQPRHPQGGAGATHPLRPPVEDRQGTSHRLQPEGSASQLLSRCGSLACAAASPDAPQAPPYTSCLCQPPVHAIAVLRIWQAAEREDEKARAEATDFLREIYPRLLAWHRYLALVKLIKRAGCDERAIYRSHPFLVKDVLFSAILVAANEALLEIAEVVEAPDEARELVEGWAGRGRQGLEKCWDEKLNLCLDYDLRADKPLRARTVAGFAAPLIAGRQSP